jgi:outer membrane lipopolysaccharide assembly protein LptE/RlpB
MMKVPSEARGRAAAAGEASGPMMKVPSEARGRAMMRLLSTFLAAVMLAGCGYSTSGNLPSHIKSVAVPTFKNKTQEPAVESTITAAVVNAFTTSGRLRVVSVDQADSILEGEVVGYDVQTVSVDNRINVRQYRLVVTVNLQFRDVRQGDMLFRQEGFQERADFAVPGQVSQTIGREEGAVRNAALEIGRRIVNLVVDRF